MPEYCSHTAESKFHANGLGHIAWSIANWEHRTSKPTGNCHLGIWIPGISLPWEIIVSFSASIDISVRTLLFSVTVIYACMEANP